MGTLNEVAERFCPECGYNLRGLGGGRCPECGVEVSGEYVSPIAWEHRETIGRWKAFWRAVLAVTFQPERVGRAVGGPVDTGAARKFRWIVTGVAAVSVVWLYGRCFGFGYEGVPRAPGFGPIRGMEIGVGWELRLIWAAGAVLWPVIPIALVVAMWFVPWSPVFRFSSNKLVRERMKGIGEYACAPLAWAPLGVLGYELARLLQGLNENHGMSQLVGVVVAGMFGAMGFVVIAAWWAPVRIYTRATHGGVGRMIAAGIFGLPAGVLAGVALGLELVPDLAGLITIAWDSLR